MLLRDELVLDQVLHVQAALVEELRDFVETDVFLVGGAVGVVGGAVGAVGEAVGVVAGAELMGECSIPIPLPNETDTISKQWFELVEENSGMKAKGRLQVSIRVKYEMRK